MNYEYEYIVLKAQHTKLKNRSSAKISALENEIQRLRNQIAKPFKPKMSNATMQEVLDAVCHATGILPDEIISKCRKIEYVRARHLFCYVCARHLRLPLTKIGLFIERDHSSVIHSRQQYQDFLDMGYQPEVSYYNHTIESLHLNLV